jgi:hypothetical protein
MMTLHHFLRELARWPDAPLHVMLPSGEFVPAHFHVTEIGRVVKEFIDCGGTVRSSRKCQIQLWVAADYDHRLTCGKLAKIFDLAKPLLQQEDLEIEVEYEGDVVSQYPLGQVEMTPQGLLLQLGTKHTDCLAPDRCGIPTLSSSHSGSSCSPGNGCC